MLQRGIPPVGGTSSIFVKPCNTELRFKTLSSNRNCGVCVSTNNTVHDDRKCYTYMPSKHESLGWGASATSAAAQTKEAPYAARGPQAQRYPRRRASCRFRQNRARSRIRGRSFCARQHKDHWSLFEPSFRFTCGKKRHQAPKTATTTPGKQAQPNDLFLAKGPFIHA